MLFWILDPGFLFLFLLFSLAGAMQSQTALGCLTSGIFLAIFLQRMRKLNGHHGKARIWNNNSNEVFMQMIEISLCILAHLIQICSDILELGHCHQALQSLPPMLHTIHRMCACKHTHLTINTQCEHSQFAVIWYKILFFCDLISYLIPWH